MPKQSAGLLVYRLKEETGVEVLLVHPGGPFWRKKDAGVWSIPKGEYEPGEDALTVALRELEEETGNIIKDADFIPLTPFTIKSGKRITAWAVKADFKQCFISSNEFEIEWPPRSGKLQRFAEVDKAEWFTIPLARQKIVQGQLLLLDELERILKGRN